MLSAWKGRDEVHIWAWCGNLVHISTGNLMILWRAGHGLYLMRRNAHFMSLAGKIIRKILAALSNSGLAVCKSMQVTRCKLLRVCNCIFSKNFHVVDVWGVGAKPYHTILALMSINCWVIRACHLWLRVRYYGTHWYIDASGLFRVVIFRVCICVMFPDLL